MRAIAYVAGVAVIVVPVAAVAGAGSVAASPDTGGDAAPKAPDAIVDDNAIVVTARRRKETLQDIPLDIQAFDQKRLEALNVTGFDSYARFAPSISFVSTGPGQSKLVIRGVTESTGQGGGGGQSSAALYLDEQPITVDAANPDPRLIDIERIEVLSGPQGTLYGASSQSGTVRIITNKPDPARLAGAIEGGLGDTRHGALSYDINGMVNLPIVDDTLALRVVGFRTRDGGYIDNIAGATPGGTKDNAAFARRNVNREDSHGGRAALRWDFAPNWKATASFVFQDVDVDGRSDYDEDAGDLKAVRFANEHYHDDWKQYGLTVDGDLGFADAVLTTAYFDRKVSYFYDNTAYDFYLSSLAQADPVYDGFYDFGPDPTGYARNDAYAKRYTAEARLTSKGGGPLSWVAGAFYQKARTGYTSNSEVDDYTDTPSYQSVADQLPGPTDIYFYQKLRYEQEQYAIFGEASYKLGRALSLTAGGRYYTSTNDGLIQSQFPFGLAREDSRLKAKENGFTPKLSLSWKPDQKLLLYATYSQGVRLGGANRDRPGLAVPTQYKGDKLTNYELGTKTQWLGGRLTVNLTAYDMTWDDIQLSVLNPNPATFFYVIVNAGKADIKGLEGEFSVRPGGGFSFGGSGTVASAKLARDNMLLGVSKGARLPVSPKFKAALYGEYDVPIARLGGHAYLRADLSHTGASFNNLDPATANRQAAYTLVNLQLGAENDAWKLNLYANNVFDERAQYSVVDYYSTLRITPARPRQIGLALKRVF